MMERVLALSIPAFNLLAALSSALAAFFWFRASQVEAPRQLHGEVAYGGPATVDASPLVEYAQESGRRNKAAALCSAAAAFFAFLAWMAGWMVPAP
jgi:hypothetical protein